MDIKEIQQLIKLVSNSAVDEVRIERNDFKLAIRKNKAAKEYITANPMAAAPLTAAPAPTAEAVSVTTAATTPQEDDNSNYIEVKSPMIGTFYRKPSPDKPVFCNVGDTIAEGDVVCVIEAMKLFNEIESEITGTIVKILVDDSTPVEYDQPLFLVDPS
jgi:acetyl-CoA carboxylase biotin carboxyl carrier protein